MTQIRPAVDPCRGGWRWPEGLGATKRIWIIDVAGKLVWIDAYTFKGAGSQNEQDIQQIIDLIQFESAVCQLPLGGISPGLAAGDRMQLWVLSAQGVWLVIVVDAATYSADKRAEVKAIFDSLLIQPAS